MSLRRNKSTSSAYTPLSRISNGEHDDLVPGIEMGTDGLPPSLEMTHQTSSAHIITAFEELSFKQHQSQKKIKNRLQKQTINKKEAKDELKQAYRTLAHTLDRDTLAIEYKSDLKNGISSARVNELLNDPDVGYNELTPPKRDPEWLRFLKCTFANLLAMLLTVGGILSLIGYGIDDERPRDYSSLILGIVLFLVVLLTGGFIFYQEGQSSNLMSALSAMKPPNVWVFRDGRRQSVEPRELVPGDLCELQMGMLIPADLRVVECSNDLEVDNSSLTGESDPQKRAWKPESEDIIPMEAKNLCFFGTLVLNGKGVGMVVQTGDHTFMGRTAALASSTNETQTPIQKEIHSFVTKIAIIALVGGVVLFTVSMVLNPARWIQNIILFFIGIVITNVPEELMAVVTIQLTLTAKILFQKNVQVKQLGSVETLGSISVICSDKTGTLTTNCMTVQHIYYDFESRECDTINPLHALDGDFYESQNDVDSGGDNNVTSPSAVGGGLTLKRQLSNMANPIETKIPRVSFLKLIRCGALCNNASFLEGEDKIDPTANATEAAIVKFSSGHIAVDYRLSLREYRKKHGKLHEIPFNSRNKWQVSVHELPSKYLIKHDIEQKEVDMEDDGDKKYCIVQMKGAPERILSLCDRYITNGEIVELNEEKRNEIMDGGVLALGAQGERVLAFAELVLDASKYDINCAEPECGDYKDESNENYSNEDCLVVNWKDKQVKIMIDLSQIKETDEHGNECTLTSFDSLKVKHVQHFISKNDFINLPMACQRIGYGNHGQFLEPDETLAEVGIKRGSLVHLVKGPYKFTGATADDINIPFNREADGDGGLVFIGLFAMIDPPRPGVPMAISHCQSAGIKVVMVTGDHPITAKAIAEKVGIINESAKETALIYDSTKMKKEDLKDMDFDAIVVPGWELQSVLDHEPEDPQGVADFWNVVLNCDNIVFARTSPQQKLLIVSAVQERGAIVAVTGDGVNDSPALKKADIGVAMGITGTEVAKESANMILLDDNFPTLILGIEQGRIIFDNLKKSIAYSLGKNMPEILPFVAFLAFGVPIPLTPLLLLCMDLGTDIMPSISLAMERKEMDIMKRRPRDPKQDKLGTIKLIFNSEAIFGVFSAFAGLYAYFTVMNSHGLLPAHLGSNMDRNYVFSNDRNPKNQRDAYYLWCFDPEWTTKCYFLPNFINQSVPFTFHSNSFPYYNQWQFYEWQMNQDKSYIFDGYALEAKRFLIDVANGVNNDYLDNRTLNLTMNMLNGEDRNGVKCCNTEFRNGTLNTQCINNQTETCKQDYLSWDVFFNEYWQDGILEVFVQNRYHDPVYENRFCEEDYFKNYMPPQKNQPPPHCDWSNPIFTEDRWKTFKNSPFSIFPMGQGARTTAHMKAQTAYVVAAVIMQMCNLLVVRTRTSSLFQQGMENTFMNYAMLFEILLMAFFVYIPPAQFVLGTVGLKFVHWTPAIPYAVCALIGHELRKGYIRRDEHKNTWLTRQTYW